jgi:hypothetical protein
MNTTTNGKRKTKLRLGGGFPNQLRTLQQSPEFGDVSTFYSRYYPELIGTFTMARD